MIAAMPWVSPRSSASDVPVVVANSVGIPSIAVASTSIVAFSPAVVRSNGVRPFFQPQASSAAPRISRTLPITEPMIEARATSSNPSRMARMTMIISGRFPNVAFSSAERRGPAASPASSVATPSTQASPATATPAPTKTTTGEAPAMRRPTAPTARSPIRPKTRASLASRPPGRVACIRGTVAEAETGTIRQASAAMRVLLTNDDGIFSPGLRALLDALAPAAEVVVIAPAENQSAVARSITLRRAITVVEHDLPGAVAAFAVDGTPVDCVRFAALGLGGGGYDAIVSGANLGHNLGDDVTYSGTVAAALEGVLLGLPSIAVSQGALDGGLGFVADAGFEFGAGARFTARLLEVAFEHGLPPGLLLNVNVPPAPK